MGLKKQSWILHYGHLKAMTLVISEQISARSLALNLLCVGKGYVGLCVQPLHGYKGRDMRCG